MLVFTRGLGEESVITVPTGNGVAEITVTLVAIYGNKVRLGFGTRDRRVAIHRREVHEAIVRSGRDPLQERGWRKE